jgi:hypothetical protein
MYAKFANMRKGASEATPNPSEGELGSFEGKYPKDLFNKTFVIDNQSIGHVAKDAENTVVIFGESGEARYDIPKSEIVSMGGRVTIRDASSLESYRQDRDSPFPEEKLRPSAEEIRQASIAHVREEKIGEKTRAEAVLRERQELVRAPRRATTTVSTPEGYIEQPEPEIVRQVKNAGREFKELFYAGSKVAKKKIKEKKRQADEKRAQMDAEKIASMGNLAVRFTEDYDRILAEIRTMPYPEQGKMYDGLITLMDYQRKLAVARRGMSARVESSVKRSVVPSREEQTREPRKKSRNRT